MKTKAIFLFAALMAAFAFTSCSSDDDDNNVSSSARTLLPGTWQCVKSSTEWFGGLAGGAATDTEKGTTVTFERDPEPADNGFDSNYTSTSDLLRRSGTYVVKYEKEITFMPWYGKGYSGTFRVTPDSLYLWVGKDLATLTAIYVRVK